MLNPFSWGNGLAPAPPPPPNADEEKMHALGHWANYDTKEQDPDKKNLDPEHIPQGGLPLYAAPPHRHDRRLR